MYKNKQCTFQIYQSKRKELERWIIKEKDEIKKAKTGLLETWRKTIKMMEDAQSNAMQIKNFFLKHGITYNSDNNSMSSLECPQEHLTEESKDNEEEKNLNNLHDEVIGEALTLARSAKAFGKWRLKLVRGDSDKQQGAL